MLCSVSSGFLKFTLCHVMSFSTSPGTTPANASLAFRALFDVAQACANVGLARKERRRVFFVFVSPPFSVNVKCQGFAWSKCHLREADNV